MGHTPRMSPRPTPLKTSDVVYKMITEGLRLPLMTTLFVYLISPLYFYMAELWISQGWPHFLFLVVGTSFLHTSMYLGLNGFFWICDKYQYLQEYKLYRSEEMMPDDELV